MVCVALVGGTVGAQQPAGMRPGMPGGVPAVPGPGMGKGLGGPAMAPQMDLSAYQGPKGLLAIRGIQGTKGGPAVSGNEAELILLHNGAPIKRYPLKLDDNGLAMVSDLPIALGLRPMVRVMHAGVVYQQTGEPLDASKPSASIEVVVHEVTDAVPQWKVVLRQVMYSRTDGGAEVAETVIVENPADTTWLGGAADAEGRRATVTLTLPANASDVQLEQGFHGWCCTAYKGSELNIQMPLMPGRMTYQFGYAVAAKDGALDLRVVAPAAIEHAAVYLADKESVVRTTALAESGTEMIDGKLAHLYTAEGLKAGDSMGVVLAALAAKPVVHAAATDRSMTWMGIGGGVLAAAVGGFVVLRMMRKQALPVRQEQAGARNRV